MWSNILDRISFWSLFCVIVLLPVFFLPFSRITAETSKGVLLVVGLAISIIFWAMARFSDGKVVIPKSLTLLAGLGVVVVVLLSAIFSQAPQMSFFGTMFDIGTFWFLLAGFLLMFFSAIVVGNRQNAKIVLLGLILSFTALFIFQTLRFFTPGALSFQVLGVNKIENLLGAWNAFGIFVGLAALVLLFILEFFSISKIGKLLLGILLLFSLLLVSAVNFGFVWMILGIFALIIFVYKISSFSGGEESAGAEPKKHFPIFSFAAGMVCLLFFNSGQSLLGRYLPSRLGLLSNEVGPTLKATLATTKAVLEAKPVLGTGPNTFGAAWAKYKSPLINNTLFWNVPFNVGSGLFPTLLSTTGYLGILSWLVFLVLFLISGLKSLFANIKNGLNTEMSLFFIAAPYRLFLLLYRHCAVSSFFGFRRNIYRASHRQPAGGSYVHRILK